MYRTENFHDFLEDLTKTRFFVPGGGPLHLHYSPGSESKMVFVMGENATGKSFVRRVIGSMLRKSQMDFIHLSQEGRSESGICKAMIYGDESNDSTGSLSGNTILTGIKTSLGRETKHGIFWDEPDIGLSDNYAAGAGKLMGEFALTSPEKTFLVGIITHRRVLVEHALATGITPHLLYLGENPITSLADWLVRPVEPACLEELQERNIATYRKVSPLLRR